MAKKRARDADGSASKDTDRMDEDSDEENFDIVNVEFEWFNFDADIDFHGTKTLLRQLLDVDAPLFDISGLADLVLAQPTIGSTVKVDGKANDAYALLTALSLREHRAHPAVATLTAYLAEKAAAQLTGPPALATVLPALLQSQQAAAEGGPHVGLVLAERLVNMPAEVAPPMFSMLIDELEAAVEDGEPYSFTHYLVLSKTYQEEASSLAVVVEEDGDVEDGSGRGGKRKKARSSKGAPGSSVFHFHPEDEVLQKHAVAYGTFAFTKENEAVADSRRAFQEMGFKAHGLLILIEASQLAGAVAAISDYLKPPQ